MKNQENKPRNMMIRMLLIAIAVIGISQAKPQTAHALFGVGDVTFTTLLADTSPTGIANNVALWGNRLKEFVLDKLAVIAARQILHQMTVSVVNWINSGFEGKPAFLTNPEGFFLDVGDQITGEFLSENGPLRRLCSPWSVDIRVALALKQLQTSYNGISAGRYTCTLSSIINNYQGTYVNGASIEGFIGGDFNQGGWPAFIALTTEDQNNPHGTYLQAYSDQLYAIQHRKGRLSADLDRGSGFMSWEDCQDLPVSSNATEDDLNDDGYASAGSNLRNKNGKWQKCETKTPGSAIGGMLEKTLGIPAEELGLVQDINTIASALMSQLVSQTLSKGLYSLSSGSAGAGSGRSYLQQVYREATSPRTVDASAGASPDVQALQAAKQRYDQAIAALVTTQSNYEAARACFNRAITNVNLPSSTQGQNTTSVLGSINTGNSGAQQAARLQQISSQLALINQALSNVVSTLGILSGARSALVNQTSQLGSNATVTVPGTTNASDLATITERTMAQYYSNFAAYTVGAADISTVVEKSTQDLATAQEEARRGNSDAAAFQAMCNSL